jgi:hypothetical protein
MSPFLRIRARSEAVGPAGAENPDWSLFVRMPNIGGAENESFFPIWPPAVPHRRSVRLRLSWKGATRGMPSGNG